MLRSRCLLFSFFVKGKLTFRGRGAGGDGAVALLGHGFLGGDGPGVQGIVEQDFQQGQDGVSIVSKDLHRFDAGRTKNPFDSRQAHPVDDVSAQPKRHSFRRRQRFALFERDSQIDVYHFGGGVVDEYVAHVAISDAQDVTDHGRCRNAQSVGQPPLEPNLRGGEIFDEVIVERGSEFLANIQVNC